MAHDDDVLDLQNIDRELQGGGEVRIARRGEIGDVAMNKHLAGIEIDDFGGRHPAVRTADPGIAWPLLAYEPF
ncbi:hypothetical protein ADT71_03330 [Novosphingobium sp. ST904]|nr:hypothetical protein ADT71_03330 [Novosphingobium sp. ST904]